MPEKTVFLRFTIKFVGDLLLELVYLVQEDRSNHQQMKFACSDKSLKIIVFVNRCFVFSNKKIVRKINLYNSRYFVDILFLKVLDNFLF